MANANLPNWFRIQIHSASSSNLYSHSQFIVCNFNGGFWDFILWSESGEFFYKIFIYSRCTLTIRNVRFLGEDLIEVLVDHDDDIITLIMISHKKHDDWCILKWKSRRNIDHQDEHFMFKTHFYPYLSHHVLTEPRICSKSWPKCSNASLNCGTRSSWWSKPWRRQNAWWSSQKKAGGPSRGCLAMLES